VDQAALAMQRRGPLPVDLAFQLPAADMVVLAVSGTVWTRTPNRSIGIDVFVDSELVGTAPLFANPAATHMAVPAIFLPVQLAAGAHVVSLVPANPDTESDGNDVYHVTLIV